MNEILNYEQCMNYIYGAERFSPNPELKRTKRILELLGNPQDKIKTIHIAGTNGKGSTTAMISSILKSSGLKVGMFTSPYIEEFEERIQINNVNIEKQKLIHLASVVKGCCEEAYKECLGLPNQFEIITCIMFKYFYDEKVDYAVIEVGLGGRFDATNVISKPELSIITSISYDHMNILGDTLEKIAFEKCGIIKEGVPVLTSNESEDVLNVIKRVASEKRCTLKVLSSCNDYKCINEINDDYMQTVCINNIGICNKAMDREIKLDLKLLGTYQVQNCALAVNAVNMINNNNITEQSIIEGLRNVEWMCRMEILRKQPLTIIDGAHNEDGILSFKNSIRRYFKYDKLILILGILHDKESGKIINEIVDIADYIIFTSPHSIRAEDPYTLQSMVQGKVKTEVIEDYREAYNRALSIAKDNDVIACCGSLYMAGDMRKVIRSLSE